MRERVNVTDRLGWASCFDLLARFLAYRTTIDNCLLPLAYCLLTIQQAIGHRQRSERRSDTLRRANTENDYPISSIAW